MVYIQNMLLFLEAFQIGTQTLLVASSLVRTYMITGHTNLRRRRKTWLPRLPSGRNTRSWKAGIQAGLGLVHSLRGSL